MLATFDIPVLETERLIMRGFGGQDVEPMSRFFASEESRFYGGPLDKGQAWRRLATYAGQWQLHGHGEWAIELKQTGAFAGFCGPWSPPDLPEPEIAWALLPEFYGKGYAAEAARRAIQFVYDDLKWPTVMSLIEANNLPSIRLAERLGAHYERDYREHGWDARIYRHLDPVAFAASEGAAA